MREIEIRFWIIAMWVLEHLIKADETKTSSKVRMRDQDINLLQSVWRRFLYTD